MAPAFSRLMRASSLLLTLSALLAIAGCSSDSVDKGDIDLGDIDAKVDRDGTRETRGLCRGTGSAESIGSRGRVTHPLSLAAPARVRIALEQADGAAIPDTFVRIVNLEGELVDYADDVDLDACLASLGKTTSPACLSELEVDLDAGDYSIIVDNIGEDTGSYVPSLCIDGDCSRDPACAADMRLCAAVRGNGQLITAHFHSLARVVEHYGRIDGAAGGSSASITIFLLDSIQKNPAVSDCGGRSCSAGERAERISLLLKSLVGYIQGLAQTDEALAIQNVIGLLSQRVEDGGIADLIETDPAGAVAALTDILSSDDIQSLINPELLQLLTTSPNPEYHVRDIVGAIQSFGSFSADNYFIFVRPGLIDFTAFADKIGRIGSFYAGYGPADEEGMQRFLADCAAASRGRSWFEAAALPTSDGGTCGDTYAALFTTYRTALLADEASYPSRIDDTVGEDFTALISTSVLVGGAVDEFRAAREQYLAGTDPTMDVDFGEVRFGYWGSDDDLALVGSNPLGYEDDKTAKFIGLGAQTWRTALSLSPAEPGLARAFEIDGGQVSAGGWSDLHPSLVLKSAGCDAVVYVTRRGEESGFATSVAGLFGAQPADMQRLYDLGDPSSSYSLSVNESDAVWCTDWNNQEATDIAGIVADSYGAPMESADPRFLDSANAYEGARTGVGEPGCTPGVSAAAGM